MKLIIVLVLMAVLYSSGFQESENQLRKILTILLKIFNDSNICMIDTVVAINSKS